MGLNLPAGFASHSAHPAISLSDLGFSSAPAANVPAVIPKEVAQPETTAAEENVANVRFSAEEEKILKLLADGHSPEVVANTLGITPSAISQHISKDAFREELARRKSKNLAIFKELDDGYNRLEKTLLAAAERTALFLQRPGEIIAALTKVNAMKRRLGGVDNSGSGVPQQIATIVLPVAVVHRFTTTPEGQVIGVDNKSLVTIPSNSLARLAGGNQEVSDAKMKGIPNAPSP